MFENGGIILRNLYINSKKQIQQTERSCNFYINI